MVFVTLLRRLLTRRDKFILLMLIFLSIFVSIVETVGISAIMVFVGLATNLETVLTNKYCFKIYTILGFARPANFVIFVGVGLLFFYLFRAVLTVFYTYLTNHYSFQRQHYFSCTIFNTFLHFNYKDFVTKNSSLLSQIIFSYSGSFSQVLSSMISIFAEVFTILCIYSMLLYISWKMTAVLTLMLGVMVAIITKISSQKVRASGLKNQKASYLMGKVYTESFWNFKFLKLIGRYDYISFKFSEVIQDQANASITNIVWQTIPRFIIETIAFSIMVGVIIYVLFMYNNANFILPIVSMYALAFYRFMPSINKIFAGYNQINFHKYVLNPLYEYLKHDFELLGNETIKFENSLEVKNIFFSYGTDKNLLSGVSFNVCKGDRVAFIGPSGAGKSTLADILMGLHLAKIGQVCIDGTPLTFKNVHSWRSKIGYIPQNVFLFDGTVAENILCGRDYDEQKLIQVLQRAQIYDFLFTKEGLSSRIGEGGVMFSGGQKQRIAIARALYSDPEILVLDEATSSLDNAMEAKIMEEIYSISANVTLIIIAHRLTTIEKCNKIFRVENGQIYQLNSWSEVVAGNWDGKQITQT